MTDNGIITPDLIRVIQQGYAINWNGIHGISHFQRVRENGLKLSGLTGANPSVVELFAFLHDSKRINDAGDPGHGSRAAEFGTETKRFLPSAWNQTSLNSSRLHANTIPTA